MNRPNDLPRYDPRLTYAENYRRAPAPVGVEVPAVPGPWQFCGLSVDSPLGIPAGPLLNGRWLLYYAHLGFDILTYKTVRSSERACYPLPNLQPVTCGQLAGGETQLAAGPAMQGSWAVSFGMPSMSPEVWRADVAQTRKRLPRGKRLVVSVVGTIQPGWTLDDLAADYARCARWAVESGADAVETNFSCPNVNTCDGQLYQQPAAMQVVAARVREAIGPVPYLVKIGQVRDAAEAEAMLEAIDGLVDGLAMTNSIAATVRDADGRLMFDGQPRGICGEATRNASTRQVALFAPRAARCRRPIALVGVGGASRIEHVQAYLEAGAAAVHMATAVMVDPAVALDIRKNWPSTLVPPS